MLQSSVGVSKKVIPTALQIKLCYWWLQWLVQI